MATVIGNFGSNKVITNLDTYTYTVTTTAVHVAKCMITEVPASGIIVAIQQNGTPIVTTSAPAAAQSHIEATASINCTAGDVISWVITSSTPGDSALNTIKAMLNLHIGSLN